MVKWVRLDRHELAKVLHGCELPFVNDSSMKSPKCSSDPNPMPSLEQ